MLSERARVKPARIPARKDSSSPVETDRERDGEEQRPFVFVTCICFMAKSSDQWFMLQTFVARTQRDPPPRAGSSSDIRRPPKETQ